MLSNGWTVDGAWFVPPPAIAATTTTTTTKTTPAVINMLAEQVLFVDK